MVPPMHPGFRPVVFTSSPRGITLPSHDTPSTQFTDFLTQPILSGEIWLKHQYSCAPHSPTQVPSVVRPRSQPKHLSVDEHNVVRSHSLKKETVNSNTSYKVDEP